MVYGTSSHVISRLGRQTRSGIHVVRFRKAKCVLINFLFMHSGNYLAPYSITHDCVPTEYYLPACPPSL